MCRQPPSLTPKGYILLYRSFLVQGARGGQLAGEGCGSEGAFSAAAPAQLAGSSRGTKCGRSRELGQHRENPDIASSVWGIKFDQLMIALQELNWEASK